MSKYVETTSLLAYTMLCFEKQNSSEPSFASFELSGDDFLRNISNTWDARAAREAQFVKTKLFSENI